MGSAFKKFKCPRPQCVKKLKLCKAEATQIYLRVECLKMTSHLPQK